MDKWSSAVEGIPVKRFKAHSMPGELHYIFIPSLARAILKVETDLIHAHSYGYFQVNISGLNKRLRDTPFVLTPHFHPPWSMWGGDRRKQLRKVYDKLFAPSVLNAVDRIIGVSHHEMELLQQIIKFDSDKIRYIPNGIDFSRFEPIPEPDEFLKKYKLKGNIVLYVGRLASNKGLEILVAAAKKILKEHPKTTFVFVGEDEGMKEILQGQAKKLGIDPYPVQHRFGAVVGGRYVIVIGSLNAVKHHRRSYIGAWQIKPWESKGERGNSGVETGK